MSLKMDGIYVKVMKISRQSWAKYSSIKVSLIYVPQVQTMLHHVPEYWVQTNLLIFYKTMSV